ncbi:hypothetical protein PUN28_001378 [Cardiocondyla obscurior]|uniref:Uncharacterized protein n=1 Tax=Cardiocondyla obscurior TaxID=286306 RepID=A0AAW2H5E2_9HYME
MDPWRTSKRVFHETATIEGDGTRGRKEKRKVCKVPPGPTIGGIKSAKERWLAARGAESDEVERNRGAKEADTIHNGLGEPARRSNATPTGITDVHN